MSRDVHNRQQEMEPLTAGQLNQQLEAMRQELFTHVGHTLGRSVDRPAHWLARWRPEIYFALIVALLLGQSYSGRRGGEGASDNPAGRAKAVDEVAPPTPPAPSALQQALVDPNLALVEYLRSNPTRVSNWLEAVADGRGLESDQITASQRERFRGLAGKVKGQADLSRDELNHVRNGLFEYLYGRWERRTTGQSSADFGVTLDFNDFQAPLVSSLVKHLDLEDVLGPQAKADDRVKTAVVMRWMQAFAPEPPAATPQTSRGR